MKVGDVYALLGMDFSKFDKDERTAKQRTETLGQNLSGIIKNAFSFTVGMGFFQAIQAGFKATAGTALNFNDTLQQATIGFTTMLGGAKRANRFLSDLAKFASKTPFEFQDLLRATQRMMALEFEADEAIPTLTAVGNAMAAMGRGTDGIDAVILALGQMRMAGRVNAQDMLQLTNAGIGAWTILAEAIGKSVAETRKMAEAGQIEGRWASQAILEGLGKRFPGMMSKMEDSWRGVTSSIKDIWQMTLGAVTKNLFRSANQWLIKVRDTMTGFYDAFQEGGLSYAIEQTFGARAAASVGTLTAALKGLWGVVTGVAGIIVRNWTLIRTLTLGVVWAFGTFRIAAFAVGAVTKATSLLALVTGILRGEAIKTSLTTGFLARAIQIYNLQLHYASMAGIAHIGVLQVLQTAIYSVTAALGSLLWPLLIIGAVLGIGTAMWSKYNAAVQKAAQKAQMAKMAEQQKAYEDSVNAAAKGTDNQADALKNLGKAASKNLQSFDEIHNLAADTADLGAGGLGDLLGTTPTAPFEMPEFDMSAFSFDMDAAIAQAKADMGGFWGWLKQSASNAWGSVKDWGVGVWDGVKGGWTNFAAWCGGFWEALKAAGGQAWDTIKTDASMLWEGVKGAWAGFSAWAGGHWDGMKVKAGETWEGIKTGAAVGWENIKTTIATKWDALKTGASTTWDTIKTTISEKWEALKTEAPQTWEEIKTAIATRFEAAKSAVLTAAQEMYDKVPKSWDEMRAAIERLRDKVVSAIAGPFQAAKETVLGIVDSARSWGRNLISNIVDGIKQKASAVKSAVSGVMGTIKGWLGFGSPTDEGPGRYADQWAPNLMRMYSKGILTNVSMVQSAAGAVARSLAPMAAVPAPVFAGMGGDYPSSPTSRSSGFGDSAFGGSSQGPMTLIVKIGERTLIDQVISGINHKSRGDGEVVITV